MCIYFTQHTIYVLVLLINVIELFPILVISLIWYQSYNLSRVFFLRPFPFSWLLFLPPLLLQYQLRLKPHSLKNLLFLSMLLPSSSQTYLHQLFFLEGSIWYLIARIWSIWLYWWYSILPLYPHHLWKFYQICSKPWCCVLGSSRQIDLECHSCLSLQRHCSSCLWCDNVSRVLEQVVHYLCQAVSIPYASITWTTCSSTRYSIGNQVS